MTSKRIERQVDDALLFIATSTGFLYARRRLRRLLDRVALGAIVIAAAGALGLVGVATAWYRSRAKSSAPAAPDSIAE
ncbi:MAG: hypothetical protein WB709_02450 [Solirubrobacteraceae bacterium]